MRALLVANLVVTVTTLTVAGLTVLGGCGSSGTYELTWTIGCEQLDEPACEVTTVRRCSAVGIDTVRVETRLVADSDDGISSLYPCFSVGGPVGRGPGLSAGSTVLSVSGLSAGGQTVTGPVEVQVEIPGDGAQPARVNLPLPPACRDGMDNDDDGLVDLFDPQCGSTDDEDESQ